ncbi:MAG: AraC family transcriptional regulator [Dysgonamonadaceae bacterium]|jgi:AraC-like DNA-binding protein|nr:AraC family transcriptional regulator [Dysgonamonadaceae bacterium]
MIQKEVHLPITYLLENEQDILWGLTISTVGYQSVAPDAVYPPKNHPTRYLFSTEKGRILNEYQLLYIIRGKGNFVSENCKSTLVEEGYMFLLFPGEWHNYSPVKKTGWDEFWIGFNGINIDNRCEHGFFSSQKPFFHTGVNNDIVYLYQQAIRIAQEQKAGFQQMLAGIVNHLLGFAYSLDKHLSFVELDVFNNINRAKIIMQENFQSQISPEEVAGKVCMSYSWFRKIFKQYTGFAPNQYLLELRVRKSKELLTNTHLSIKEIAYTTGFDNADHFCTFFKKKAQMTPVTYRNFTQGRNL